MKYQILLTPQQHQEMMKQAVDNFFSVCKFVGKGALIVGGITAIIGGICYLLEDNKDDVKITDDEIKKYQNKKKIIKKFV